MAVADYESFVWNAAHLDDPDPVAHWREVSQRQAEVCRAAVGGQRAADRRRGHRPDGRRRRPQVDQRRRPRELPRRRGVHQPRRVQDPGPHRLLVRRAVRRPRGGRRQAVVRGRRGRPRGGRPRRGVPQGDARPRRGLAQAGRGRVRAERRDPAATGNIAFDEKIGGTCHVALGLAFPLAGAPTSRRCTGTWSATCATAARSTATASCSSKTGGSCDRSPRPAAGQGGRRVLARPRGGQAGADPVALAGRAAGGRAGQGGRWRSAPTPRIAGVQASSTRSCREATDEQLRVHAALLAGRDGRDRRPDRRARRLEHPRAVGHRPGQAAARARRRTAR